MIEIKGGSEVEAIATTRFEAWLEIERADRQHEFADDYADANAERERQNNLPKTEQDEINCKRVSAGKEPHVYPLRPLELPAWEDRFFSVHRCELAKRACSMTKAERDKLEAEFKAKLNGLTSNEHQDVQQALAAWDHGEDIRTKRARVEDAKRKAEAIIAKRKAIPDAEGLDFSACFKSFGPEGGEYHGGSEWQPKIWDKLPAKERKLYLQQWERAERLLPVYYEYARQSVNLLQLAVIRETIRRELPDDKRQPERESSKPSIGGCLSHPLDEAERKGIRALHGRIGGYAEAVITSLGKFLVADVPYPLIPLKERKWAADFAMSCNKHHHRAGPWLSDAGPVLDPWVMGEVERDWARLATMSEATSTVHIPHRSLICKEFTCESLSYEDAPKYCDEDFGFSIQPECDESGQPIKGVHRVKVSDALNVRFESALRATTSDGKAKRKDGRTVPYRALDGDGGEVLALRVCWKDTLDSDLVEALEELIKKIRPREKWPERVENPSQGSKWEMESKAALKALIELRQQRDVVIAINHSISDAAELVRIKEAALNAITVRGVADIEKRNELAKGLEQARKKLERAKKQKRRSVRTRDRELATRCFKKIAGDEVPWWEEKP